jgi:hypothetical protein
MHVDACEHTKIVLLSNLQDYNVACNFFMLSRLALVSYQNASGVLYPIFAWPGPYLNSINLSISIFRQYTLQIFVYVALRQTLRPYRLAT